MKIEMDFVVWLKFQDKREDEIGRLARCYLIYLRGTHSESKLDQTISMQMAREESREGYSLAIKEFSER